MTSTFRQCALGLTLAAAGLNAWAEDSCGVRIIQRLANNDLPTVVSAFAKPHPALSAQLQAIRDAVGTLDNVAMASKPRFESFKRQSVFSNDLPARWDSTGHWVNATSSKLGPVQFHVDEQPKTACRLLAIQLDRP